jgi:hypothetical protein
MLSSTSARGHKIPNSLSSTTVSTRRIGNRYDIEVRRERDIDSRPISLTRHTTNLATLDLHGDPVHKRWYTEGNHHTYSGSDYSTVGVRDRLHPAVHIHDSEGIDIETNTGWSRSPEGVLHDHYHNYEDWDDNYDGGRDHDEDMGYDDYDIAEIVEIVEIVEAVEAGYDHEGTANFLELDMDTSLEHDGHDFEDYNGDDDTYAHDQPSHAHYDEGEVYDIEQVARELGLDAGDVTGFCTQADVDCQDESEFDVLDEGVGYDGDENDFDGFDEREQDYGDAGGQDYDDAGEQDYDDDDYY